MVLTNFNGTGVGFGTHLPLPSIFYIYSSLHDILCNYFSFSILSEFFEQVLALGAALELDGVSEVCFPSLTHLSLIHFQYSVFSNVMDNSSLLLSSSYSTPHILQSWRHFEKKGNGTIRLTSGIYSTFISSFPTILQFWFVVEFWILSRNWTLSSCHYLSIWEQKIILLNDARFFMLESLNNFSNLRGMMVLLLPKTDMECHWIS